MAKQCTGQAAKGPPKSNDTVHKVWTPTVREQGHQWLDEEDMDNRGTNYQGTIIVATKAKRTLVQRPINRRPRLRTDTPLTSESDEDRHLPRR